MRKCLKLSLVALSLCFSAPAVTATDVIVEFGPAIERRLERLEKHELRRETFYRDRWTLKASRSPAAWYAFASSSERLIPDLRDFSLKTLAERMVKHNLAVMGKDNSNNTLVVTIEDFYGPNFSLPSFQGINALVKGELTLLNADGETLFDKKFSVRTRKRLDIATHYFGDGHPYPSRAFLGSFGPMFSIFLHQSMGKVYPGVEVPKPIVIRSATKASLKKLELNDFNDPEIGRYEGPTLMRPAFALDDPLLRSPNVR